MPDRTRVRNISGSPVSLSGFYRGTLPPGGSVILDGTEAEVIERLGGVRFVRGVYAFTPEAPTADPDPAHNDGAQNPNPVGPAPPSSGLPPFIGQLNAVLKENPLGTASWGFLTSDDILPPFVVSSFLLGGGTTREVGVALTNPSFTAAYTGDTAAAATISESSGNSTSVGYGGPVALISPYTAGALVGTWNSQAAAAGNNNTRTFLITADSAGGVTGKTATVQAVWRPRVRWDELDPGGSPTYDGAFIAALARSALASSRARTLNDFSAGAGEFLYYAIPTSYGTPTFTVNGFAGGFSKVGDGVSYDNGLGNTQPYDIWKSDNAALGSPTVVVT